MPGQTPGEIAADIKISVIGDDEVRRAAKALIEFNTAIKESARFKQIAINQTRDEIASLKESNGIMKAKSEMSASYVKALAVQRNKEEDYTFAFENRMQLEQDALRFQKMYKDEGISLSIKEARVVAQANAEIVASDEAVVMALKQQRRELMQVSISLFVMSITANQMLASILPLVKGSKAATAAFKDMKAALNMALAPLQFYLSFLQIMTALQLKAAASATMLAAAFGGAFMMLLAIRQEAPAVRALMGALATATLAWAAASFINAMAKTVEAGAVQLLNSTIQGNIFGFIAGLALIGAAVAVVGGYIASAKSAQTRPGQMKRITKSGLAEVHEGEVWRPAKGSRSDVGSGGGDTIIYLPPGYSGTMSQSRFFAQEVNRLKNTGQGTIKFRRAVVS